MRIVMQKFITMTSKLKLPVESRMQGDLQVRFGGRSEKTYRRKAARRLVAPSLHVKYAKEPLMLNIEMADFIHDGEAVNRPNNAQEIYLKELGKESPMLVHLIMKSIHKENKRKVKHIGSKRFGIQYLLKGIYVHSDLLYFHTEIKNQSNVPFDVDYITFKVVDKKVAKRTAIQEQVLLPVRAYNYVVRVAGKKTEQTVFCLPKFTILDDKELVVEMNEKEGGRHQSFVVENSDLVRALTINELSVK